MSIASPFWPAASPVAAFVARRARLQRLLGGAVLIFAGLSRPRNFHANRYRFRAESHFLYLVGRSLEGAALIVSPDAACLYVEPVHPDQALWTGPTPSLDDLADELSIQVRPMSELVVPGGAATLPPQDAESAFCLGELLGRDVDPASGDRLEGDDRKLADAMIELRLRHDEHAVAQLRQAAFVTERAHRAGFASTRPDVYEAAIRGAMEGVILGAGMGCSYNPIVTVHGEVLHSERHDGIARSGDLLLADVGAETPEGWAGDVTRTWPVSGRYSESQRALYECVLASQRAAIEAVRPGVRYLDVHHAAGRALLAGLIALGIFRGDVDDLYARGAAALFFPHGVGHLLGLDVHDMEDLGDRAGYAPGRVRNPTPGDRYLRLDRDLEPGMAVTIEPGFYQIPQLLADPAQVGPIADALDRAVLARYADVRGIRIEDDVLVTSEGGEVLTRAIPKTVADIESAMRG